MTLFEYLIKTSGQCIGKIGIKTNTMIGRRSKRFFTSGRILIYLKQKCNTVLRDPRILLRKR